MSAFNTRPTAKYKCAVTALLNLPLEERFCAFADATAPDMEKEAKKEFGKSKPLGSSWRQLIGNKGKRGEKLPGDDHARLWPAAYVSHPYHITMTDLREIVKLCDAYGLSVQIDAKSWYFPSKSIRVTYRRRMQRDEEIPAT